LRRLVIFCLLIRHFHTGHGVSLDFYIGGAIIVTVTTRVIPPILRAISGVCAIFRVMVGHFPGKRRQRRSGMPTGTVKWFNTTKGYGFIAPDDGGKDVFVHISAVERSGLTGLADNQKVGFELQDGRDGRQMASDLKLL